MGLIAFIKQHLLKRRPKRKRLDLRFVSYAEGDRLIRENIGWDLAPEEDKNFKAGMVWIELLEKEPE